MAHRAVNRDDRPPSSHKRDRRPSPLDGPASMLLEEPVPRDFMPNGGARVTIRYPPPPPRRDWAGWFRRHWADLAAWALIAVSLIALYRVR